MRYHMTIKKHGLQSCYTELAKSSIASQTRKGWSELSFPVYTQISLKSRRERGFIQHTL
jgi:hypothetical protein